MTLLFPTITTSRLVLRPLEAKDATPRYESWLKDPEINAFLETRFSHVSIEDIKNYIETVRQSEKHLFLAITVKETKEHIGNIKLGPIDSNHQLGEIGIMIGDKNWWGKGIATEVISAVTDYAFKTLKLHKVVAGCYANNEGSAVAFEKAGFKREALRPSHFISDGKYVDYILLGAINPKG